IVFVYCVKSSSTSPEQKHSYLRGIVLTASLSVEKYHPTEHPQKKKHHIAQRVQAMLTEQKYHGHEPFTIDALIDEAMLQADTDPRLRAIRIADEPTRQITPPLGMWQLGMRQKAAASRTGKLV